MNETNKIIKEKLEILGEAIRTLAEVVAETPDKKRFVIDISIQRFEYTFELMCKTLKVILLEARGIDVNSPKAVLQEAFQQKLIDDIKIWLEMIDDRNLTSHTYNRDVADKIYSDITVNYYSVIQKTYDSLKQQFL